MSEDDTLVMHIPPERPWDDPFLTFVAALCALNLIWAVVIVTVVLAT